MARNLKISHSDEPVDLGVSVGERIGLLGTQGSGKRRLLQVLARLERPAEGKINWNGVDVTRRPRWLLGRLRHHALMIWANPYALFGDDNTVGGLLSTPVKRGSIVGSGMGLYRSVLNATPMNALSAVQRVRVALAYALAQSTQVILLDDLFAMVSPAAWPALLDDIATASGESRGVIIASQYKLPMAHVDRIFVMLNGTIVEQGVRDEVLGGPQHPYTRWLVSRSSLRTVDLGDWRRYSGTQGNGGLPSSEELP